MKQTTTLLIKYDLLTTEVYMTMVDSNGPILIFWWDDLLCIKKTFLRIFRTIYFLKPGDDFIGIDRNSSSVIIGSSWHSIHSKSRAQAVPPGLKNKQLWCISYIPPSIKFNVYPVQPCAQENHGGPMSEIRLYFFFIFVSVICHLGKPQYFRQQSHHHWRTSRTQLDRIPRRTLGKY